MTLQAQGRAAGTTPEQELTPEQEAAARAAGVWIHQFARTLKTCRLYDSNNPAVIRFRTELALAAARVLDQHGALVLRFTADDVTCEGLSLYPAKSRDDNIALPFYRDGVRGITLHPGLIPHEVDTLIDAVLTVTSQTDGEDDLVTLLWEAQLAHFEIDFVPSEGDHGEGGLDTETGELVPWPASGAEATEGTQAGDTAVESVDGPREDRSDDWTAGELTVEIEAGYEELESLAPSETERFRAEFHAEHEVPLLTASMAVGHAYLCAGITAEDRVELARFLPRLLRQAVTQGSWAEAQAAFQMLRACASPDWVPENFMQELLQPISVSGLIQRLDETEAGLPDFIAFAEEFGEQAVDLLNLVLAESQSRNNRRVLAETIARHCRDNPERLAPWLSDPRWFVVRNIVHILGWIGTPAIVGLLQSAVRHPDPRVRQEVVAALGSVEPRLARPLLLRLIDGADSRMLLAALHQLSASRDPVAARVVLRLMQAEAFDERPLEEKRAIYSALAATGDDSLLPDLEEELHRGNWFSRNQEVHRQAVARCVARLGTAKARAVLEQGLVSRRAPLRKACEDALAGFHDRD